ncbi:protein FAM216A [Sander vitreus]
MKKQVTFAENQTIHRLHHAEAMQRSTAMNESKMALKDAGVNFNNGLKFNRLPAARCEPQLQHVTTIQIPKTITAAPFLKHAALTPAQKEYLYTMAASYSTTHVRHLITQHYVNVLHRCIQAGYNPEREDLAVCSVFSPRTDKTDKPCSEVPTRVRHKDKIKTSARNTGKSFLPKIPNRRARSQDQAVGGRGGGGGGGRTG